MPLNRTAMFVDFIRIRIPSIKCQYVKMASDLKARILSIN